MTNYFFDKSKVQSNSSLSQSSHHSNTIIITSLPKEFFHPLLQASLRLHFSSYGVISNWISLPGLSRILVVYREIESAKKAKFEMNRFIIQPNDFSNELDHPENQNLLNQDEWDMIKNLPRTVFRIYFGPSTKPTLYSHLESSEQGLAGESLQSDRLKPPLSDKNFLISPPGSPPVGWNQAVEDAPNQNTLADDLTQRLKFISVGEDCIDLENDHDDALSTLEPIKEITILVGQPNLKLPTLKVQHSEPIQNSSKKMEISLVKATIESLTSSSKRITPTARPTLESYSINH
ncbi:hypothetical protein O181_095158 [Austropuccinia psidii MF-1]|uniref:Calcipressin n=1 Tax=Austropuccinia psidii MF-1 TaxID=1389203 RepID=A0A9Q3J3B8_9BASI|nr:hypothetical protein [Austropuccinia psidii MF-1]